MCATHRPPDTRACYVGAAGPAEGNRKHHPKAAPPRIRDAAPGSFRVFSQPQKMVFDCVYGRPCERGGCDNESLLREASAGDYRRRRQHVTISHMLARFALVL